MSLTKSNLIIVVSCACILLVLSSAVFFPKVVDNLITGFTSFSSFSVAVSVLPASNESNITVPLEIEPEQNRTITFFSVKTRAGGTTPLIRFIEADYIEINTTTPGVFEDYIILHNPESVKKELIISFTTNFIYDLVQDITLEPNESIRISIPINTKNLKPGEYTDYILIRSDEREEKITVNLKLLGEEQEEVEGIIPEQEQSQPIVESPSELPREKKPAFLSIILLLIGTLLVICMVFLFLHLRKGMKAIKNEK
jgi:predicted PurR-regulated permease PerM